MVEQLLKHYLPRDELKEPFDIIDDVEMAPGYGFYLLQRGDQWYVLAEAPYFYAASVVPEINDEFSVEVLGWCKPLHLHDKELLPPEYFADEKKGRASMEDVYSSITCMVENKRCSLLKVAPKS
jgi:hypothetical protein